MSALVRKEIRLLLPSFGMALLLTFSLWLVPTVSSPEPNLRILLTVFPFLLCPAMLVMTALDSFGREISSGTFANLLAQPVARGRIWWTKVVLLAGALGIVSAAWWLSFLLHMPFNFTEQDVREMAVVTPLFVLAVFTGGLWTVLLFRQVAAAFWFTVLAPFTLLVAVNYLTEKNPNKTEPVLVATFCIYALIGIILSWRLFSRAQDVQWTGGTISVPNVRGLGSVFSSRRQPGRQAPILALLAKEFQLHQSLFVIAAVLALTHLGVIAMRKLGGGFKDSPALEMLTLGFWAIWMVMPLLIGCTAVAEERKLGTLESQLCLPVSRRKQILVKFAVASALAVFFGVAVPLLFEGRRILPDLHAKFETGTLESLARLPQGRIAVIFPNAITALNPLLPLLPMLLFAISFVLISFYASTMVRNTLQSLAPAVLGIVLTWMLVITGISIGRTFHLWQGWIVYLIGIPVMMLVLAWLAYWNFKHVMVGWPVWRRNGFVCLGSLACVVVLTNLIYNRAWERLTPIEPAHGNARLRMDEEVALQADGSNLIAKLHGGKVWTDRFWEAFPNLAALITGKQQTLNLFPGGRKLEGTNWAKVTFCNSEVAAIQNDGSLWVSAQRENPSKYWQQRSETNSEVIKLVRVGNANDWKDLAGRSRLCFLIKTNGTLWQLGETNATALRESEPRQLGSEADWAEFSQPDEWKVILRKTNGQAWAFSGHQVWNKVEHIRFDDAVAFMREPPYDGLDWRGLAWMWGVPRFGAFQVGVRKDGTFRVCGKRQLPAGQKYGATEFVRCDVQLGSRSNWRALASIGQGSVVTLDDGGSLWRWDFSADPIANPNSAKARRLGTHSDWVAMTGYFNGIVTLAADGNLWRWRFETFYRSPSEFFVPPLLTVSRRPEAIGNVLGTGE